MSAHNSVYQKSFFKKKKKKKKKGFHRGTGICIRAICRVEIENPVKEISMKKQGNRIF
jgi:hypothetical protein